MPPEVTMPPALQKGTTIRRLRTSSRSDSLEARRAAFIRRGTELNC
jgi:hypothetical protein